MEDRGLRFVSIGLAVAAVLVGGLVPRDAAALSLAELWPFGRAETASEPVPDPFPYQATLTVHGQDRALRRSLEKASELLGREDSPPSGLAGLLARASREREVLVAVLYENARYSGEIGITIDGRPIDAIGPFDVVGAPPVVVSVIVDPGEVYVFGVVEVYSAPYGFDVAETGLAPGEPAGSEVILAAEAAIADAWRERGHPLVQIGAREVVADHRTATLDVTLFIEPGPVADFGRVSVEGAERVDPRLIAARAGLGPGRYSPMATRRAERRVRDLGPFASVRVRVADRLDPDGTIPVTIVVTERKPRVIGASAAFSNVDGFEAETYWAHRNLFGGAEQLRLSFAVSRIGDNAFDEPDVSVAVRFRKPAVLHPMTDFTLRVEAFRETTDSYSKTAFATEAGLSHIFSDTLTGGVSLEVERSRTRDAISSEDHLLTTVAGTLDWDRRDDRLDPTEGFRLQARGGPTYDFIQNEVFATVRTDLSSYRALDDERRLVAAGRVSAAVLFAADVTDVASDRRLYAGGGGSVRGYAYRNIGPRNAAGKLIGGRSLLESSGELRYRVNDRYGLAAFVDAGVVGSDYFPDFGDIKIGVGGGIRYATPIGPLRLDVAVPLDPERDDPTFAIYVGLGQAF